MSISEWLTTSFVESVLRKAKGDLISVTKITVEAATSKGDNYSSEIYRIYYYLKQNNGVDNGTIIVKTTHSTEGKAKSTIRNLNIFPVEMKMMTSTLREMELALEDTRLSGECYYTNEENPTVLVMEDLAPLGFKMANREAGLDLIHCTVAMQKLAKFHASSVLITEKNPELKKFYNKGIFAMDVSKNDSNFYVSGPKLLVQLAATWTEITTDYKEKMKKLVDVAYERACNARKLDENEFNVINHGDFWVNNMMFKYNKKCDVIDAMFVRRFLLKKN